MVHFSALKGSALQKINLEMKKRTKTEENYLTVQCLGD